LYSSARQKTKVLAKNQKGLFDSLRLREQKWLIIFDNMTDFVRKIDNLMEFDEYFWKDKWGNIKLQILIITEKPVHYLEYQKIELIDIGELTQFYASEYLFHLIAPADEKKYDENGKIRDQFHKCMQIPKELKDSRILTPRFIKTMANYKKDDHSWEETLDYMKSYDDQLICKGKPEGFTKIKNGLEKFIEHYCACDCTIAQDEVCPIMCFMDVVCLVCFFGAGLLQRDFDYMCRNELFPRSGWIKHTYIGCRMKEFYNEELKMLDNDFTQLCESGIFSGLSDKQILGRIGAGNSQGSGQILWVRRSNVRVDGEK
jgi:hypothetical protein